MQKINKQRPDPFSLRLRMVYKIYIIILLLIFIIIAISLLEPSSVGKTRAAFVNIETKLPNYYWKYGNLPDSLSDLPMKTPGDNVEHDGNGNKIKYAIDGNYIVLESTVLWGMIYKISIPEIIERSKMPSAVDDDAPKYWRPSKTPQMMDIH